MPEKEKKDADKSILVLWHACQFFETPPGQRATVAFIYMSGLLAEQQPAHRNTTNLPVGQKLLCCDRKQGTVQGCSPGTSNRALTEGFFTSNHPNGDHKPTLVEESAGDKHQHTHLFQWQQHELLCLGHLHKVL